MSSTHHHLYVHASSMFHVLDDNYQNMNLTISPLWLSSSKLFLLYNWVQFPPF